MINSISGFRNLSSVVIDIINDKELKNVLLSQEEIAEGYKSLNQSSKELDVKEYLPHRENIDRFLDINISISTLVKTTNISNKNLPRISFDFCKIGEKTSDFHAPAEVKDKGYNFNGNKLTFKENSLLVTQYPYTPLGQFLFWELALEQGSFIVDLTNDQDKMSNIYYPSSQFENCREMNYEGTDVKWIANEVYSPSLERVKYTIKTDDKRERDINRFHFNAWPDHEDADLEQFFELVKVLRTQKFEPGFYPLIHCRAGVGRTGVLVTFLVLVNSLIAGEINRENLIKILNETILEGRRQRSPVFVQTKVQYKMLVRICEKVLDNPEIFSV